MRKTDPYEQRARDWEDEARSREQQASRARRGEIELSPAAQRMLNAQANVYRACARDLREAMRRAVLRG